MKIEMSYRVQSVFTLAKRWNDNPLSENLKLEYNTIGYLTEDSASCRRFQGGKTAIFGLGTDQTQSGHEIQRRGFESISVTSVHLSPVSNILILR